MVIGLASISEFEIIEQRSLADDIFLDKSISRIWVKASRLVSITNYLQAGQIFMLLLLSADFFPKLTFFKIFFQSVKQFGSRSGPTFCLKRLSAVVASKEAVKNE